MSPVHFHVCRLILKLDRIPRYGRVYRLRPLPEVKEWRYMKRGLWGFYLLDRFDWLDLFELESEYRQALKESNG
jgi:hypothetical protein